MQLYHSSYTSAVETALDHVISEGFTTDQEEVAVLVGMNSKRPKEGKTTRVSVPVYKNDKLVKNKALHFQVYNRGNNIGNNFELNRYIA